MATVQETKETFYADLVDAVSSWVDQEHVRLAEEDIPEARPAVAYEDFVTTPTINGVGSSPHHVTYDENGNATEEHRFEYRRVQFDVTVLADSDSEKAPIYEAVRNKFNQYDHWETPEDFHPDAERVKVEDTSPHDVQGFRGDTVTVEILVEHTISRTVDPIESVDLDYSFTTSTDYTTS